MAKKKRVDKNVRHVDLEIRRIHPWSVLKVSFLLSVAISIGIIIAALIIWVVLYQSYVFGRIEDFANDLGSESITGLVSYLQFSNFFALTIIICIFNIFVMTALSTIISLLYNVIVGLVGGIRIRLLEY